MSSVNLTNLLLKLAAYNNAANSNIQTNVRNLPEKHESNLKTPNTTANTNNLGTLNQQQANSYINLNNNINNILNREIVNRQLMKNYTKHEYSVQKNPVQNNIAQYNVNNSNLVNQNIINAQTNRIIESFLLNKNQPLTANSLKNTIQTSTLGKEITSKVNFLNNRAQNIVSVKEMMNLPQEMEEVLTLVQNQVKTVQAKASQQASTMTFTNIDIKTLTQIIQNGSKDAINQLVSANFFQKLSKTEQKQIQDAISYLNASSTSQESQTQALKNFMLLYLPWLPLEEGMDFELDFSFSEGTEESDENILNITIMTKHFGEIHILIILKTICSFEIYIQCCKKFPKNLLLKLVGEDERKHSIQSNYVFEEQKNFEPKSSANEAKITLSNVNEISPFLLLIANSLIKNTLLLDVKYEE